MKNGSILFIAISSLLLGSTSCSTEFDARQMASTSEDTLRMGPFKEGNFIPDEKPLGTEQPRDLREIALSLPIWENSWETSEEWVYQYSENGIGVDEWTNPADGAQHAVKIRRLKASPQGRTRVEVHHPPLKIFTPSGGRYDPWVAVLERRKGGWLVESANKKADEDSTYSRAMSVVSPIRHNRSVFNPQSKPRLRLGAGGLDILQ